MNGSTQIAMVALLAVALLAFCHKQMVRIGTGPTGNYVATPTTRYPLSWKLGLPQGVKGGEGAYTGGRQQVIFIAQPTRVSQEHL